MIGLAGTPRGIAGGVVFGLALSLVPVPFAGMFVALALAPWLRLNLAATYVGTAIVNPLSGVFFYAAELWIGLALLGRPTPTWSALRELDGAGWFTLLGDMLGPFLLGAVVLAVGTTLVTYPLVMLVVTRWRRRWSADTEDRERP